MDPTPFPTVTQAQVDQAYRDKLVSTAEAIGISGAVNAFNYFKNAPGGFPVQFPLKALSGFKAVPGPSGRGIISLPRTAAPLLLLPQPLGFVPAEAYGLHPEFYKQALGRKIGQKPPFFSASADRIAVYEAREAANKLFAKVTLTPNGVPNQYDPNGANVPAGPINLTPAEYAYLASLPPGLVPGQVLLPQIAARQADLIGAGSTSPATVEPTNDSAIRNFLKKFGIDRELATERADP